MKFQDKNTYISRRRFLVGLAGISAFPFLEINAASKTPSPYKRMMIITTPFGFHSPNWMPDKAGRDYTSGYLPLYKEVKKDVTLLTNLSHGGYIGHAATSSFLTGIHQKDAYRYANKNESLDQLVARHIMSESRYPSLNLAVQDRGEKVSWTREGVRVPEITKARTAFDLLFKPDSAESLKAKRLQHQERKLMLEVMQNGFSSIKNKLSQRDQFKLGEYRESIRNLGIQIGHDQKWIETSKANPDESININPSGCTDTFQSMLDLSYWSLKTNTSRMITLSISRGMNLSDFKTRNYHSYTHHGQRPEKLAIIEAIDSMVISRTAQFIKRLRETPDPEGNGSMLDNTIVLLGSGMQSGNSHSCRNIPLMLAGGGFKHGTHKPYQRNADGSYVFAGDLLYTLARRFGLEVDKFNKSSRELVGLI